MLSRLLLLSFLLLQDSDLDRLIQQLGDQDPARREQAVRKIREIGPKSRESLEQALKSTDPEVRARASSLLDLFERERVHSLLETKERKKVFPRITMEAVEKPRGEVLAELSRHSGWQLDPSREISQEEKVTLKAKDMPMIEALDRIGLEWFYKAADEVSLGKLDPSPGRLAVFDDGIRATFSRRVWSPQGNPTGTIFETKVKRCFDGEILQWSVASVKTDVELAVETCAIHSPGAVYVPVADLANPQVRVKGTRLWYCPTPIEFTEPKNGDVWKLGPCEVTVEWPSIRVRMDKPMTKELLRRTLSSKDIQFKAKVTRERDFMGVGVGGGGGGRFGGRFGGKNRAWCGCLDQPATKPPASPPMEKEFTVAIEFGELYAVREIKSISITFHKPVEDAFELVSPPLK